VLLRADVRKNHGGQKKHGRRSGSQLAEQIAGTGGSENGAAATAEDYPHALLAGLQQDENDKGDTGNDMYGYHQGVQKNTS
jgi:hypothetical protein